MASFVLSVFPLDVLDGIWYLIESVSEGFLTLLFHPSMLEIKSNRYNHTTLTLHLWNQYKASESFT